MGNQCSNVCLEQPDGGDNLVIKSKPQKNTIYTSLIQSSLANNEQFPQDLIPQTVKQKLRLFNIDSHINEDKQLWKHTPNQNAIEHQKSVYYIVTDKQKHPAQLKQETHKQQAATFQPEKYNNLTVYVFRQFEMTISDHLSNKFKQFQDEPPQQKKLKEKQRQTKIALDKIYHGKINQTMTVQNAVVILQNGQYFQGNLENFTFSKGIMKNAIGSHSYEGQWKDGRPHGEGSQTMNQQFQYKGGFQKGKWQRKGTLTLLNQKDRFQFKGNFQNGALTGNGQMHKNDKLIYKGEFKDGKQHGMGHWQNQQGEYYDGQFVQGNKQGFGTYYFGDNKKYVGTFKNGKPDGQGELYQGNNQIRGQWYNGQNILVYNKNS